jgi:hypothetical protein
MQKSTSLVYKNIYIYKIISKDRDILVVLMPK